MTKKFFTDESLNTFVDEIKKYTDDAVSTKADSTHTHAISEVTNLQSSLDAKVPTSRTINGKALTANISLSASDVNAYSKTETDNKIDSHNVNTSSHNDIRVLISDLSTKVNNFLDVDDTTRDELSEVIALIDANKGTLESLTTSKVNVADIIDNLTTANASKVLSANQGVAIKALIDALQEVVDGKAASVHTHVITDIPSLTVTATELNYMDGAKSNIQEQLDGKAATSHGNHVPATETANNAKFLRNDNTWQTVTPANIGAVPATCTINGKALSGNITLSASDVGAPTVAEMNTAIEAAIGAAIGGSY